MSYSILAGLPPVYGLYASFFPPFLYSIFGSAKHSSIGVFSITCLMVDKCVKKMLKFRNENPESELISIFSDKLYNFWAQNSPVFKQLK